MSKFTALPDDVLIVVMGPTGSGKTNFINTITGNPEKAEASRLRSATRDVTPYKIWRHGRRVVLFDTPGFDDTYQSDMRILRKIADWLTKRYPNGDTLRFAGIVYLHRITDNRISAPVYKNLQLFGRICGNIPLYRARLVTTMWDKAYGRLNKLEDREKELIGEFWQPLIDEGARARRFGNTESSAFQIIDEITSIGVARDDLLLQEELVKQKKHLNETEAGKVLYSRLQKLFVEQKNKLMKLADEARLQGNSALAESHQVEYDRTNARLQTTFEEIKEMKVSYTRRIIIWLFGRRSRGRAVRLDDDLEFPTPERRSISRER